MQFTKIKSRFNTVVGKAKLSVSGILKVIVRWRYLLVAVVVMVIFSIIFGLLSMGSLEVNMLLSRLSIVDKLDIVNRSIMRVFSNSTTFSGVLTGIIIVLQGIAIALLAFNIRHQRENSKAMASSNIRGRVGESAAASVIAMLGLGCSTCGTSLLLPLLALVSSSAAFLGAATTLVSLIAIGFLLYSLANMGYTAYVFAEFSNKKDGYE